MSVISEVRHKLWLIGYTVHKQQKTDVTFQNGTCTCILYKYMYMYMYMYYCLSKKSLIVVCLCLKIIKLLNYTLLRLIKSKLIKTKCLHSAHESMWLVHVCSASTLPATVGPFHYCETPPAPRSSNTPPPVLIRHFSATVVHLSYNSLNALVS